MSRKHRLLAAFALVVVASGDVLAHEPPAPVPSIQPLRLVRFTDGPKEFAWAGPAGPYYPDLAARNHIGGRVSLNCVVGENLALDDCRLQSETPTGYGFGDAALLMARKQFITVDSRDGMPVGRRGFFAVEFATTGEKPCPPGSRRRHC